MKNFTYCNPVKIYFGEGQIEALKDAVPKKAKILMTYGGGSIKANGVYDQVMSALQGYDVQEFSGIEPNPSYETLMRAVVIVREQKIDFLLAVGGGSVIDGTKFIAAAAPYKGEPWDIVTSSASISKALPIGCVLTIPAAGSEMNCGAVISKKETHDKLSFMHPLVYPQFSILDPKTTYSLPPKQTANGIVDAFVHVTEQYLTYPVNSPLQDRMAEGILLTLIEEAPKVFQQPDDYDARANIMWAATLALNDLIQMGVPTDWATHLLGHELTAAFGIDHGESLAIILPSLLHLEREPKREKLVQYARRVWGINASDEKECIDLAITKTRAFFESLGIKTRLSDFGVDELQIPRLIESLKRHGMTSLGERGSINLERSAMIFRDALFGA
ncbi:MAG: iron-containing alcohol dehydrogenase [Gammaproteobacteria bacterium]